MSEAEFRTKRRQKFLTEHYFKFNNIDIARSIGNFQAVVIREKSEDTRDPTSHGQIFKKKFDLLRLHYTAGEPIETLKPLYNEAMHWFREWHEAYRAYVLRLAEESGEELRKDGTPTRFEYLGDFQLVLDCFSIGVLLGETSQVHEAAKWLERYRHTDMLFEFLIERFVSDPSETETFFHEEPYGPLVDAIFTADTPQEAEAFVKQYLDNWYKAFEGIPWHNGHLKATDEYMPYEGYWAFDAAAVCILKGIDDSSFRDHMVYPKDLADWAREHVAGTLSGEANRALQSPPNVPANAPCPTAGWWFTPAKPDSRRYFKQGDPMPSLGGDYGETFWQWSPDQSAPKL
ncbi:MAG: PoNe immunity protein domain-containing protein [Pseudomonadota bacterium]